VSDNRTPFAESSENLPPIPPGRRQRSTTLASIASPVQAGSLEEFVAHGPQPQKNKEVTHRTARCPHLHAAAVVADAALLLFSLLLSLLSLLLSLLSLSMLLRPVYGGRNCHRAQNRGLTRIGVAEVVKKKHKALYV
jgi:hypothetical protein